MKGGRRGRGGVATSPAAVVCVTATFVILTQCEEDH